MQERQLYSEIQPYNTGLLPVGAGHHVYYEESGNPQGQPIVFIHGGPGSGSAPDKRQLFNPEKYRIILFDQRGCGQSTFENQFQDNTTSYLVADIEMLRKHLQIDLWSVFGGSWGSTLALVYAQAYPTRVKNMVLYGIFLANQWMRDWHTGAGQEVIFPDAYDAFLQKVNSGQPFTSSKACVESVYQQIFSEDTAIRRRAILAFSHWHLVGMSLLPKDYGEPDEAAWAWLEQAFQVFMHYEKHDMFLKEDQILKNMPKIAHIPAVILQGRYDMCCPPKGAWDLHKAWKNSQLHLLDATSHKSSEPAMQTAILDALDTL